jgi:hypothetical protein
MKQARAIETASRSRSARKSNAGADVNRARAVSPEILALETRRRAKKIPREALYLAAKIDARTYERMLAGSTAPQRGTRIRLKRALEELAGFQPRMPPQQAVIAAFHRAAMAAIAYAEGRSGNAVVATDFSRQRPEDPEWLAAARIRAFATDIAVCELDLEAAAVARAIGISKAAIGKQLKRVADLRDDPAIEAVLDGIAKTLTWKL